MVGDSVRHDVEGALGAVGERGVGLPQPGEVADLVDAERGERAHAAKGRCKTIADRHADAARRLHGRGTPLVRRHGRGPARRGHAAGAQGRLEGARAGADRTSCVVAVAAVARDP